MTTEFLSACARHTAWEQFRRQAAHALQEATSCPRTHQNEHPLPAPWVAAQKIWRLA